MATPTPYDVKAARNRQRIADSGKALLQRAIKACGPDAVAYGFWTVIDRLGKKRRRKIFCCRRPEHTGWQPEVKGYDERATELRYEFGQGQVAFGFRFQIQFSTVHVYQPKSAQQLAELRETREQTALEKERRRLPLFADQIKTRDEGRYRPKW